MNEPAPKPKPLRYRFERAVLDSDLPATNKLVALALATYSNKDGMNAWPGNDNLSRDASVSDKTVRRALARLREVGLIERTYHGSTAGRRGRADEYQLRTPVIDARTPVIDAQNTGHHYRPPDHAPNHVQDSEFSNSGSAQAPTAHDQPNGLQVQEQERANDEGQEPCPGYYADYPEEQIADLLGGVDGTERNVITAMLEDEYHPKAIVNTVEKARGPFA